MQGGAGGADVTLYEMRPALHMEVTAWSELVCSNSLGSNLRPGVAAEECCAGSAR